ncbi:MAG: arylsulfatase [Thermoprotei archaeon]|nr:arylsulfatase [Thermoprotei archaeon]
MAQQGTHPNVVLILTDDLGYGDLGCHGNDKVRTPNLDRFHRESVRFTRFYTSPLCSPTRAGLLTGRYEYRSGIRATVGGRELLRHDEYTVAEIFSMAGYRTGIFGKWHLGDNYPLRAMDRGFQETLVHGGGGIGQTPDAWGNTYFNPALCHNGRWKRFEGYCTDIFFEAAMKFIEENKDRPFFVYIPTNAPHTPLQAPEEYVEPYRRMGLPERLARYYAMVTSIDYNVGRLVRKLQELELDDKTLVIFMSDNGAAAPLFGPQYYNAGLRAHKGTVYEGGIRVPCFFRWPEAFEPKDVNRIAAYIDILPTLLDICRIPKPVGASFDGVSLLPLIRGEEASWPDRFLFIQRGNIPDEQLYRNGAVISQRYKLVYWNELYDLETDPGETTNIADEHPEVVKRMREAYDAWWRDVSPGLRDPVRIHVGSIRENPVLLTCHDWWDVPVPKLWWRQDMVVEKARTELEGNGYWEIYITRTGRYSITLYKCHPQAEDELKALKQGIARLKIGDIEISEPTEEGATSVTFHVDLRAGPARLQTFLGGQRRDGKEVGALFIEIKYLE